MLSAVNELPPLGAWNPFSGEILPSNDANSTTSLAKNNFFSVHESGRITIEITDYNNLKYLSTNGDYVVFTGINKSFDIEGRMVVFSFFENEDSSTVLLSICETERGFNAVFALRANRQRLHNNPTDDSLIHGIYLISAEFDIVDKIIEWKEPIIISDTDRTIIDEMIAGGADRNALTIIGDSLYGVGLVYDAQVGFYYGVPISIDLGSGIVNRHNEIISLVDSLVPGATKPPHLGISYEMFYGFTGNFLVYGHELETDDSMYLMQYVVRDGELIGVKETEFSYVWDTEFGRRIYSFGEIRTYSDNGVLLYTYASESLF